MQHSAVDLENYARMYLEDQLRASDQRRRAGELAAEPSLLERLVARVQSWITPAPQERESRTIAAPRPAQLVPLVRKPRPASADPYAGMIVLVRGPKEPCSLDAA